MTFPLLGETMNQSAIFKKKDDEPHLEGLTLSPFFHTNKRPKLRLHQQRFFWRSIAFKD